METRECWLNELDAEELRRLNPWDVLLTKNATNFLIGVGRGVLSRSSRFGLSHMSNEELLHELYPMLCENLPCILSSCADRIEPENRDRFVFGCLRKLVNLRLNEMVFGTSSPSDRVYIEEITAFAAGYGDGNGSSFPPAHSLMSQHDNLVNAFIEANTSHEPQFLADSERVLDEEFQQKHVWVEQLRPLLTGREVEVLRSIILQGEDRSIVALEIGSTPKQVSRYRQSIRRKLRSLLGDLGWTDTEVNVLLGYAEAA